MFAFQVQMSSTTGDARRSPDLETSAPHRPVLGQPRPGWTAVDGRLNIFTQNRYPT